MDNDIILDDAEETDISKLVDWENPPSLRDLQQDLESAQSAHSAHVVEVGKWLDILNGVQPIKTKIGRSKLIPKLVRKQAEWRYAALSEPFLATDDLFTTSPATFEDKKSAEQNGLVLNYQINCKIDKVKFIDEYVRTSVDEGSVLVRVGWEFEEDTRKVYTDVIKHQQVVGPDGQVVMQEVKTGEKSSTKTITTKNQPVFDICDYRNTIIDPTCNGDIERASFIIYKFETSSSALKKDGRYKNLENVNFESTSVLAEPDYTTSDKSNFTFKDKARKKLLAIEYWGYWDIDNSGEVTSFVATWVGKTMIRMEKNPYPDKKLPFVLVQYLPRRKHLYGEPDAELIEDNQKIIGALTRGAIDIMGRSANGQQGIRKDALDVTNARKFDRGEDYKFNANVDPKQAFHMGVYPEIPRSLIEILGMQNNEAESLTGVKAFSSGISGVSLGSMLDVNTEIPMADGSMHLLRDIQAGDQIIGSDGRFTEVTISHPIQLPKAAYDITFTNGATIKSGVEHLWTVKVSGTRRILREWHTVDTATLVKYFNKYADRVSCDIYIPRLHRPRTTQVTIPMDAYCLGAWLGDGAAHGARITSPDPQIVQRFIDNGFPVSLGASQNAGAATEFDIMSAAGNIQNPDNGQFIGNLSTLHTQLRSLNLLKRYGGHKHIPEAYFTTDYYVKLELLRGLMDTDGYAHSGAFNVFCQGEGQLKDDVIRLLYSMGTIPRISKCLSADEQNRRKAKYGSSLPIISRTTSYEIGFTLADNPFFLDRKAKKYKAPRNNTTFRILNIVEVDRVWMRCLTVAAKDSLYAVGKEFTLTHNTATGIRSALDATSKRELGILRRLSTGLTQIGRKVISMNAEFLEDEEIIRVTNEQFVEIDRNDLGGNYDIKLSISTAEADNEKAQELAFMLQTTGPNSDPGEVRMIRAEIARLRKMPELAKRIEEYQPQPDPLAQQMQMLEMEMLKARISNEQAKAQENTTDISLKEAKTATEQAKTRGMHSKADMDDLSFVQSESGVTDANKEQQTQQAHTNKMQEKEYDRLSSLDNTVLSMVDKNNS